MKRIIITIALAATLSVEALCAGAFDSVFSRFKGRQNVEYVKVPKMLLKLGLACGDVDLPAAKGLDGVRVLSMSGASDAEMQDFGNRVDMAAAALDELMRVNDGGNKVLILSKKDGERFKGIYIVTQADSVCALIELSGKFTADDIRSIIEGNTERD